MADGEYRQTDAVDVVVALQLQHIQNFMAQGVANLGATFFAAENMIRDAVRHKTSFNLLYLASLVQSRYISA